MTNSLSIVATSVELNIQIVAILKVWAQTHVERRAIFTEFNEN